MSNISNQVSLNIEELKGFMTHIVNNNRYLQASGKSSVAVEVVGESGIGKTSSMLQLANELSLNIVKLNLAQIEELGDLVGFPIRQFQLCKNADMPTAVAAPAVYKTKKVTKKVPKEVTTMEKQMVEEFDVTKVKKQVLEGGKFVTKEIETKVPRMVEKEVPVTVTVMEDVEVEEKVLVSGSEAPVESVKGDCVWVDDHAVEEYRKLGYTSTGQKRMSYCPPEWIADKQGGGILILDDWNRSDVRFIQAVMELN